MRSVTKTIALCFTAMLLSGCGDETANSIAVQETPAVVPSSASRAYVNARIWTGGNADDESAGKDSVDKDSEFAEAMALDGNRIKAVGSLAEIQAFIDDETEVIDLAGQLLVPGFIDNHTHFILSGLAMTRINLRDADTPEEFSRRIAAQATKQPGEWIIEGNWDHELWGGELPTRDWIDAVTPDTPVFVLRLDRHMALANSKALELAGLDDSVITPQGGAIIRDESGRMTGLLKDAAMKLVEAVIPPATEAQQDQALQAATELALSHGVTQVHDMGEWGHLQIFQRAKDAGKLRLRVYEFSLIPHAAELASYIAAHGRGDDLLRWGGVKGFVDGSLGSTTAWFYQPYDDAPETSGMTMTNLNQLRDQILAADRDGLQVAVHAIGDNANDWLLDTFADVAASNGPRDRRFRIEHAQHLTPEAIPRFAELGVVPSMQPYHAIDDGRWAEKRIGSERIKATYAFRSLVDANAKLTFGSDWAVAPINPMQGMDAAVTRRTIDGLNPDGWVPGQKISVLQALKSYTQNNAFAGFQEDKLGRIAPGYLADFVVLSANLFTIDPDTLPEVRVLRTVVNGVDVFVAP